MGSTCDTAMRISAPPISFRQRNSSASPSAVTTLATRRPPPLSAVQQVSIRPGAVMPPPIKTASGGSRPSSARGAGPVTISSPGTPRAAALWAIMAERAASFSTATARAPGAARSHSMAIEPQPAPTSHSLWRGSGASAARVAALTSRLVICPSWLKASSGSPGTREWTLASGPGRHSTATVLRSAARSAFQSSAVPSIRRSAGPPKCSNTAIRLGPKPRSRSVAATRDGVSPSRLNINRRASGAM